MKILLFVFILVAHYAFAQTEMVVYRPGLNSVYNDISKKIYSIKDLPRPIVDSATSILKRYMGDSLSKRLTFSLAQVIDTGKYFKIEKRKIAPSNLPMYQLAYELKIPEIGIRDFTIELRMTQSGTPLKLTWPRTGAKDISVFLPLETIRAIALKKAQELKFPLQNYKLDFFYDERMQKFLWQFNFPIGEIEKEGGGSYHRVSINWLDPKEFDVAEIFIGVTY